MPIRLTFSEGSGLNDSVYGKCQAPIRMFLEKRGEAFEQESVVERLFLMGTSENYGDLLTSMTAMAGFEPVGENGAYPEDSKLMDLRKQPGAFMTSYHRTRELFGAALYGGAIKAATTAQFKGKTFDITTADGQPLFSAAHPAKVSGPAQCNLFKDAFSVDALGQMETAMQIFCGDTEEILDVSPDTILIPDLASLKKDVFAAIGADKDPATSNNAFNYQFGRWTVICWPYLNKFITAGTAPWILLDSKYNEQYGGAVWNDRIPLAVRSTIDENTDANVWRGRSRWNATFNDWRFAAIGGISTGEELPD